MPASAGGSEREMLKRAMVVVVMSAGGAHAGGGDPWADAVVDFDAGIGGVPGFDNPATVLGSPTRLTSPTDPFGGPTTPFRGAFGADEVLSIGEGGFVTVRFDEPVMDDPANPFGIDLLVFGNSFYFDTSFPDGVAGPLSSDGGLIEVSADGSFWTTVTGVAADGLLPTLGYSDLAEPFGADAGTVETDFTLPVDPSFDPAGKTFAEIVSGYNGSGGGAGVDLGALGLSSISYVRVSSPIGSGQQPEIDGFADVVPSPGAAGLLGLVAAGAGARRKRA